VQPGSGGLDAQAMLAAPRKAYLLLGTEPELDCADGAVALAAMKAAEFVVALSPFEHRALDYAEVILPIAPFTETAGTFVNTEGRAQAFTGVVKPLGDTRPAWKVLRVLGNLLGLPGFDQDSTEAVLAATPLGTLPVTGCDNRLDPATVASLPIDASLPATHAGVERIAPVRIHDADALARRAPALQKTRDAAPVEAAFASDVWVNLALVDGDSVRVSAQGGETSALFPALRDPRLPKGCMLLPAGHPTTHLLSPVAGALTFARVPVPVAVSAAPVN